MHFTIPQIRVAESENRLWPDCPQPGTLSLLRFTLQKQVHRLSSPRQCSAEGVGGRHTTQKHTSYEETKEGTSRNVSASLGVLALFGFGRLVLNLLLALAGLLRWGDNRDVFLRIVRVGIAAIVITVGRRRRFRRVVFRLLEHSCRSVSVCCILDRDIRELTAGATGIGAALALPLRGESPW